MINIVNMKSDGDYQEYERINIAITNYRKKLYKYINYTYKKGLWGYLTKIYIKGEIYWLTETLNNLYKEKKIVEPFVFEYAFRGRYGK